jgi:hypothetical protein
MQWINGTKGTELCNNEALETTERIIIYQFFALLKQLILDRL